MHLLLGALLCYHVGVGFKEGIILFLVFNALDYLLILPFHLFNETPLQFGHVLADKCFL